MWCRDCHKEVDALAGAGGASCPLCFRTLAPPSRQLDAVQHAREILERWQSSDLFERITATGPLTSTKQQDRAPLLNIPLGKPSRLSSPSSPRPIQLSAPTSPLEPQVSFDNSRVTSLKETVEGVVAGDVNVTDGSVTDGAMTEGAATDATVADARPVTTSRDETSPHLEQAEIATEPRSSHAEQLAQAPAINRTTPSLESLFAPLLATAAPALDDDDAEAYRAAMPPEPAVLYDSEPVDRRESSPASVRDQAAHVMADQVHSAATPKAAFHNTLAHNTTAPNSQTAPSEASLLDPWHQDPEFIAEPDDETAARDSDRHPDHNFDPQIDQHLYQSDTDKTAADEPNTDRMNPSAIVEGSPQLHLAQPEMDAADSMTQFANSAQSFASIPQSPASIPEESTIAFRESAETAKPSDSVESKKNKRSSLRRPPLHRRFQLDRPDPVPSTADTSAVTSAGIEAMNRKFRVDQPGGAEAGDAQEPVVSSVAPDTKIVSNSSAGGRRLRIDTAESVDDIAATTGRRARTQSRPKNRYIDDAHESAMRGPHFEITSPPRSNLTSMTGQFLAYLGVLGLTIGTAMVIYGHFGGYSEYTPTGWLVTTVAQMLLFLGVINLVSGGIEQNNEDVSRRINSIGDQLLRIEQVTSEVLRGPKISPRLYDNPEAEAAASAREKVGVENE